MSPECRDLISKLLMVDPVDRISVKEALGHEWFASIIPEQLSPSRSFRGLRPNTKNSMDELVTIAANFDFQQFKMEVAALDEGQSGFVSAYLLSKVLCQKDTKLTGDEIETMLA